jgi:hypothetical protein
MSESQMTELNGVNGYMSKPSGEVKQAIIVVH